MSTFQDRMDQYQEEHGHLIGFAEWNRQFYDPPETLAEAVKRARTAHSDPLAGIPAADRAARLDLIRIRKRWALIFSYMAAGLTERGGNPSGATYVVDRDGNKIETTV